MSDATGRRRRGWGAKFAEAGRGVKLGVRGQSSFSVHIFFAALALVAAAALGCSPVEWCLVVGCIGLVLTAELMNSSIELLFRGLDQEARDRVFGCLHIAAGAVLVASGTAVVIGGVLFGRKLLICWGVIAA
jgi:diacylglycerol kinase